MRIISGRMPQEETTSQNAWSFGRWEGAVNEPMIGSLMVDGGFSDGSTMSNNSFMPEKTAALERPKSTPKSMPMMNRPRYGRTYDIRRLAIGFASPMNSRLGELGRRLAGQVF